MQWIDGKSLARTTRRDLKAEISHWTQAGKRRPGLVVVQVGEDPASKIYVAKKRRLAARIGCRSEVHELPAETPQASLEGLLQDLAQDPAWDGILLQLPLPEPLDADRALACIPPEKDVDGLTFQSLGLLFAGTPRMTPCTPKGILRMLDSVGVELEGARALVVGRSRLVGRPMASLLTLRNATVTLAHSRTQDLPEHCRDAEILVAACGQAELIRGDWIRPGATVIDVGIHRHPDGSLTGDVHAESVAEVARYLSPVPGGVGPMTVAMLLENTLEAYRSRMGLSEPGRTTS